MTMNTAMWTIRSHLQLKCENKILKVVKCSVLQNIHRAHTMHCANSGIYHVPKLIKYKVKDINCILFLLWVTSRIEYKYLGRPD